MHVIPRSFHALSMNTTHGLHAFYACVGAAISLTGTAEKLFCYKEDQYKTFCLPVKSNCPSAEKVNEPL